MWRETKIEERQITCSKLEAKIEYGELNLIEEIKELTIEEAEKELEEKYECKVKIRR